MSIETITTLIVAIIGSGGISSVIASFLSAKRHKAEVEQLRQQIQDAEADTKIKIDEHIHQQMLSITETYKHEFDNRNDEIKQLREQNEALSKQVRDLNDQINQLMSWVVYDSMRYQEWLEHELLQRQPDIQFPKFRKPPKFVQNFMNKDSDAPDTPPQGFTEEQN